MSRFSALPLRTRLLGQLSLPMDWLPHAPEAVLRAVQRTGIHPVIERLMFGKSQPLPKIAQRQVDTAQGPVDVRLYYPSLADNLPVILFFHAGGWVIGNLETHDVLCRRLAAMTGALVLAVDYHLSPWVKFPVPVRQGEAVLAWLQREAAALHADASRVLVMGDSAGGNLSAVLARRHAQELKGQVLIYPATDGHFRAASADENRKAPILSKRLMQFFYNCYARTDADRDDPDFSPLLAPDLTGLPPCLLITAEYDVLRDDGFAYAQRLQAAGVRVRHEHYPDVHGFLSFPSLCASGPQAFAQIGRFITQVL